MISRSVVRVISSVITGCSARYSDSDTTLSTCDGSHGCQDTSVLAEECSQAHIVAAVSAAGTVHNGILASQRDGRL